MHTHVSVYFWILFGASDASTLTTPLDANSFWLPVPLHPSSRQFTLDALSDTTTIYPSLRQALNRAGLHTPVA